MIHNACPCQVAAHPPVCPLRAGGPQQLCFEVAGRDAFANACPLAPEDVTLACSPAHALRDISIGRNSSPATVVVKATVSCEGDSP